MSGGYSITAKAREILKDHGFLGLIAHSSRSVVRNWKEWRFRPYVTRQRISGEDLTIHIADQFGESWYSVDQDWIELTWVKNHLVEQGTTVVDVGTNHGVTAVLFSRWVGEEGHVVAVDGRGQNVQTARENARLNHASNIEFVHSAVGNRIGTVDFMDQPNGGVLSKAGASRKTITVPMRTLDDILAGRKASLLKIDVEGHELAVLEGASRTLESVPNLDVEIHCPTFSDPAGAITEILERIGARRYDLHWQISMNDLPVPATPELTPEVIGRNVNVHLFARRRSP
jgi:FkbM family methyltransferase